MAAAAFLLLGSCTKISEPYYKVKSVEADTSKRTVLLEDYTGHLCTNCAPAGKIAHSIQELYDGQVIAVAVHAGSFAKPNPAKYFPYLIADYRTEAGNTWFEYSGFNIPGTPRGMVNRTPYNGNISFGPTDWNEAVKEAVKMEKIIDITVNNSYNAADSLLSTTIGVEFLKAYTGSATLTVCVLEDSIYGGQLNNEAGDSIPIVKHYLFMHMLRGSLNGSWGEGVATNPAAAATLNRTYTCDFKGKGWVPGHCSVIAFISDAETREVLQAAKSDEIGL